MKPIASVVLVFALSAGAAVAQTKLPAITDEDNSGNYSLPELQTVWPDLTEQGFAALDADQDGAVTEDELQQGLANAVVTAPTAG